MHIEKIREVTDEVFEAVCRLVPEIGTHKSAPALEELKDLVHSESSTLWISRYPDITGSIVGMLTITIYRVPTGVRSIVEDVAVDSNFRRRGIARALMEKAIEFAQGAGAENVALTSNPKREAANLLYQSMGFEKRETNSYSYKLK